MFIQMTISLALFIKMTSKGVPLFLFFVPNILIWIQNDAYETVS